MTDEARVISLGRVVFGLDKLVLIGSLFYKSDRKVRDHRMGIVDKGALMRELRRVKSLKTRVGLEHAIDVIAETPVAMENYLDILAGETDDPIFVGGLNEETRIAGYRKAKDLGIAERCGVNSVSTSTTEEELNHIKDAGIGFAIVQTLDPSAVLPREKLDLLRGGLLDRCINAGLKGIVVDVGIADFTSAWLAAESIKLIGTELGIPAGCAPSNAAYQPLASGKVSRKAARSMNVALNTMMQLAGAGFIIYGPLRASSYVFEAAAMVEAVKGYGAKASGIKMTDRNHPLFRYLPKLSP
jgi:tetrahydromethanopterin S-methyltransferase subunit H